MKRSFMVKRNLIVLFSLFVGLGILAVFYTNFLQQKKGEFQQKSIEKALTLYREGTILKNIELTKDGPNPKEITIRQGTQVSFVNASEKDVWPASDPHPTHDYLSGFDPGRKLSPGEKWSYTFNKEGIWRFHDHLNVSYRGTIHVLGAAAGQASSYGSNGQDFDELVRKTVHEEGIDAAYKLFTDTYEKGELPRTCHWTAHQIGESAYELFKEGKEFNITNATSYCGFGFYHGFLEGLLREKPDTEYALNFCAKVEKQLGVMGRYNCIHGIGHGFTEDPPDPSYLGSADLMLRPGIRMCERLFGESFQDLNLCLTGVYTVIAGFTDENEHGLVWNDEDPFAFCRTQEYRYQKACFGEFVPKLDKRLNWDLTRIPKYLEGINDDKITSLIVWVAPSVFMAKDILSDDHSAYIQGCRKAFTGNLQRVCWAGTILGFFSHGEPEKQYKKVVTFCNSNSFSTSEREFCFEESLRQARQNYNGEKMKEVCNSVPLSYQKYCFTTISPPPYTDPSFDSS